MAIWLSKKTMRTKAGYIEAGEPAIFPNLLSNKVIRLLFASFLSGSILLALEVIWFRFLILFFVPHSWNFTVMLAMVLSGISLGGLLVSQWFRLRPEAHSLLIPILFLNGILVIILYSGFSLLLDMFSNYSADIRISLVSLFLIFPVSFLSGIIFTMLGKALHVEMKAETKAAGLLTLANTTGGMLGSLVAGLIFIPYIGIEKSFFLLAFAYGVIAFLVFDRKQFAQLKRKMSFHHVAIGAFLISLIIFPFGLMNSHYLEIPWSSLKNIGEKRVALREGLTETIQYLQKDLLGEPYYYRLVTNNYSMSGTFKSAKRYMKLFAYWPVALHPKVEDTLLICFGCGSTAKALTDTKGIENIEIVDTSRDIVEMSNTVFRDPKENPINDARVKIHIEDGRFFLLTTERKFDLITAEPPPPAYSGIVNLYTQEYFQLIYDRLSEGGIVTYWLPVYQLKVSEAKSILKGFCNVFKDCSLWSGAGFEWMMVGVKNPQVPVSEEDFIRQWNDPVVESEMHALGFESPEQFGSLFIADGQRLRNWIADSLPLVDNYPRRLSYGDHDWKQYLPVYRDFMNQAVSRVNFMASENISKLWPEHLRKKTEKYFTVRQTINEMLAIKDMRNTHPLMNLHTCIHNTLLTKYILWALDSDQYAQRIISKAFKDNSEASFDRVEICRHLAAGAAQQLNYRLAEKYLHLAADSLEPQNTPQDLHYDYSRYRMYLLFIAGDQERAMQVGQEYIDLRESDKAARREQISKYWNWLVKTVATSE
jgi:spermidine synthase